MNVNHIETYLDGGHHCWRILDEDNEVVADSDGGYATEHEALTSLFGIFFGDYDESFLVLYAKWNPEAQQDALFPEPVKATSDPAS
jgi:hypothetical protein